MRTRLILRPGQPGTRQLTAEYGDRLLYVRYRYDAEGRKRYKTVELIVSVAEWATPARAPDTVVAVRVARGEADLARAVAAAGGTWDGGQKVWNLRYEQVEALNIVDRIVPDGR